MILGLAVLGLLESNLGSTGLGDGPLGVCLCPQKAVTIAPTFRPFASR